MKFYTSVVRHGNNILYRGNHNGKRILKKVPYQPTLYVESPHSTSGMTTMHKIPVEPKIMESMSDAKKFIDDYASVHGMNVHGMDNYVNQFVTELFPDTIDYNPSLIDVAITDIEVDITTGYGSVEKADKPISAITLKRTSDDRYHVFTYLEYDKSKTELAEIGEDKIVHHKAIDEKQMLEMFIAEWESNYPDVVTGWNSAFFDVGYLGKRIEVVLGEFYLKKLSPWGIVRRRTVTLMGNENYTYDIHGVANLDFMDVFKKFGYSYGNQESYKLDHIAHVLLGERKLSYEEFGDLNGLMVRNPQKYIDYNIKDVWLVVRMIEKTGLLNLCFSVAYKGGVNYEEALGTTGIWDSIIYRVMTKENMVPPLSPPRQEKLPFEGGFVKQPIPNAYKSVVTLDLASLYPHIMMQYNMSPEMYVRNDFESVNVRMILDGHYRNTTSYAVAANGACFKKEEKGIIPRIIALFYAERSAAKKKMLAVEQEIENASGDEVERLTVIRNVLNNEQMAIKILMNALYGASANVHFRYHIKQMAEGITTTGQLAVQTAEKFVNECLNAMAGNKTFKDYVIYCDTDSVHICLHDFVEKYLGENPTHAQIESFLDQLADKKLQPSVTEGYEWMADVTGAFENKMSMKREKICVNTIYSSKKRYGMLVLNSEGVHYDEPYLSITGLAPVRSTTPEVCRQVLKDCIRLVLEEKKSEMQEKVATFKTEFFSMTADKIGKVSGTDDINAYSHPVTIYRGGTPAHVKSALLFNNMIKSRGLENRHELIVGGDKIKFVYLTQPNPVKDKVIGFKGMLPRELGIEPYIDYNVQFDKVFVSALKSVTDVVGWPHEDKNDLSDFW